LPQTISNDLARERELDCRRARASAPIREWLALPRVGTSGADEFGMGDLQIQAIAPKARVLVTPSAKILDTP